MVKVGFAPSRHQHPRDLPRSIQLARDIIGGAAFDPRAVGGKPRILYRNHARIGCHQADMERVDRRCRPAACSKRVEIGARPLPPCGKVRQDVGRTPAPADHDGKGEQPAIRIKITTVPRVDIGCVERLVRGDFGIVGHPVLLVHGAITAQIPGMTGTHPFHAHIYFDPPDLDRAKALAEAARLRFGVKVGHFHEKPVGPHPRGSCQLTVAAGQFGAFAAWAATERKGLTIFAHAETGNDWRDHTENVVWFGVSEPLNYDIFVRMGLAPEGVRLSTPQ